MRELILLRHAHAEPAAAGQDDAARPLSAIGREEAAAAGDWLRSHGARPDRVLCSPSTRTRQTLAGLGDLSTVEVREDAAIYPDVQRGMEASVSPGVLGSREERVHAFHAFVARATERDARQQPMTESASSRSAPFMNTSPRTKW